MSFYACVQELEKRLAVERERCAKVQSSETSAPTAAEYMPYTQNFQAIASCELDSASGVYRLSVEIPTAIDLILLQVI